MLTFMMFGDRAIAWRVALYSELKYSDKNHKNRKEYYRIYGFISFPRTIFILISAASLKLAIDHQSAVVLFSIAMIISIMLWLFCSLRDAFYANRIANNSNLEFK